MSSEKSLIIENDIPGVSIRRIDNAIEVYFIKSLTYDEWREFENFIDSVIKHHFLNHSIEGDFTSDWDSKLVRRL